MKPTSLCLLSLFLVVAACTTTGSAPKMSFEEARDVVLSMQNVPLEPPPRKMDDILALLDSTRYTGQDHMAQLLRQADTPVPQNLSRSDLVQFYKSRGTARYELNRFNDAGDDYHRALDLDKSAERQDSNLYNRIALLEMYAGRYEIALDLCKTAMDMTRGRGWHRGAYMAFQSRVQHRMGNFWRAGQSIILAKNYYNEIPSWARHSLALYGDDAVIGYEKDIIAAEAELLEAQGRYSQAYSLRARVLNYCYSQRETNPLGSVFARLAIASNLMHQGRLVEAEREARMAVSEAMALYGKNAAATAAALQVLGAVMLAKGDLPNADILSVTQVEILEQLGLSIEEDIMIRARLIRADVLSTAHDYGAAMDAYDRALTGMQVNPYLYRRYTGHNPSLILCLIKNQRFSEARKLIDETRGFNQRYRLQNPYDAAEILALEAMILHANRKIKAANEQFSRALPDLVAIIQGPDSNFQKRRRANTLLQFYIDMLLEIRSLQNEQTYGIDVVDEIFKLTDARYSQVGSALGESSARAASLANPELAELVRQEQDAGKKLKSLEAVFHNAVAASGGEQTSALVTLKGEIQSLTEARASINERIGKDFPKYASYTRPRPPGLTQIQAQLSPQEALIAIWTLEEKTCVWAIPHRGNTAFTVVNLREEALRKKVDRLRQALRLHVRMLSEIPRFDLDTAFEIYDRLLHPVESGWQNARSLLVVVNGPLDQVPLSVLPTQKVNPVPDSSLRFKEYRQVPWLIRKASITRLPSAATLLTLRALPDPGPGRDPFAGFGDPVFSLAQLNHTPVNHTTHLKPGTPTGDIAIRGIRISNKGEELDSKKLSSVRIEQLCRLPDTADEIRQIAASLDADPGRDVFLGKAASETVVKTRDFSRKKILAFATHALLPGDLDGLTQPALAFSAPEVTELDEDGLLTVGEILTLKLDADLVVLSACDTGAGDGSGSEAVSGLGRAFFYSGARALLVTMWPVETTSANKLTTGLFRIRQEQAGLSWARAQQQSILQLMEDPGLRDTQGVAVASYAHPMFWGPFVVIGASGVR
jgi:CHAT domain-containing protein